jgi:small subunit ribosomal protein S4
VTHGHIRVDGRKVDRPSYEAEPGTVITLKPDSPAEPVVRRATELVGAVPAWLLADHDNLSGRVERAPERDEIDVPVKEQLIVELYSK